MNTVFVLGGIIIFLVIMLYFVARKNGKTEAKNELLEKERAAQRYADNTSDARMSRFEERLNNFEKKQKSIDYDNATDEQLRELHQGTAVDDVSTYISDHTVADSEEK